MNQDSDCSCIECVRTLGQLAGAKTLGQLAPPAIPGPAPLPGLPGTLPAPFPGLPGTLPAPFPEMFAPPPVVNPSSSTDPDSGWLSKMLERRQVSSGVSPLPTAPSAPSPDNASQAIISQYQAGVTAFQQLTAVHSLFRTTILAPHFANASEEDDFFYSHADSLQKLRDLLISVPTQEVVDMVGWLQGINPDASYSPDQWVLLVEKLLLGQDISFPSIELPHRIISFLSKVLRSTVTGAQEAVVRAAQDQARHQLFLAVDVLSQAQADFSLSVSEANVPANADPVEWASSILSQAGSPTAQAVITAQSGVDSAKRELAAVKNQIQALDEEMAALSNTSLTPDQLAQFLMQNLPPSSERERLKDSYARIESLIAFYQSLSDPLQASLKRVISQMSPYQDRLQAAMSAFVLAREPINVGWITHQSPSQDQLDAFNLAQTRLSAAQAALAPYQDEVNALEAALEQLFVDHPEFLVEGKVITDPDVINDLVKEVLSDAAREMPSDLMSVVESAMQVEAKAADARCAALQAAQKEMIEAKASAFQQYYQDQVEAKLAFYRDQMTAAQDGYNEMNGELTALSKKAQDLQDQAQANINALGQVIGWWVHEKGISDQAMNQPYFISAALNSVMGLAGKYDVVYIEGEKQVFWNGPGDSASLAGETLVIMSNQEAAVQEYNMKAPALAAQLNKLNDWMTQIQQAFQVTQDQVNSKAYAQSLQPEFSATPQGRLLKSEIESIVNPLRQISLRVQSDQKTLDGILSDLEKKVLADNGCNLSEIRSLDYGSKKHLWVGVMDHLKGPGGRLDELQGYIAQMSDRIHAGTPAPGDSENLQLAKVALMNILAAQNIQRTLEKDISFMAALHAEAEGDTNAAVENIQTSAEGAALRASGG